LVGKIFHAGGINKPARSREDAKMGDDVEAVAQRLEGFISKVKQAAAARRNTTTSPYQGEVTQPDSGRLRSKGEIYRKCLGQLSPEERAKLHEIIEKIAKAI
jgi:hypothetical protein